MRIVQVVPHMPPPAEGVGSYAQELGRALAERRGIETVFHAAAALPPDRRARALEEALAQARPAAVLLHYANYGYQRRGCPVWLLHALRRWRRDGTERRLVTVFHEVYATGPPWRSSFWTQPLQRWIAAAMARASDALVTSLDLWVRRIGPAASPEKTAVTPVFSTVGEPEEVPPLAQRDRRVVVFGGAGVRGRAWGRFLPALAAAVRALGATEVCDVGPPVEVPGSVGGVPVRALGILPPAEVSGLLLGSAAGFLGYPQAFLPKSTIFAAYCAHGVLPVCVWDDPPRLPGQGLPCWTGTDGPGDAQAVASAAWEWYAGHALARQAERFRSLLAGGPAGA